MAHVATILGSPGSPIEFISSVVDMNCNVLETAAKETSVKRFVYTSSSESAVYTSVDQPGESPVTSRSWNELAITRAQGVSSPSRGFDVYAASKTRGEQTIWTWIREHKPGFVANTGMGTPQLLQKYYLLTFPVQSYLPCALEAR